MKLTCNRQELTQALSNIQHAVSSKSSIPALEGILLRTENDMLIVCGYDLEIGMTTGIEASCMEHGSVVLNARLFSDIIRRLPEDTVLLMSDEKNITTIISGQSQFSIPGIPAEEYPELPVVTDTISVSVSHAVLKSMIRQTIFAVAETDTNPVHTGTMFEIGDQMIRLISVDGFRLAVRSEPISSIEEIKFVVPGKTLSEISKLLKDDDTELSLKIGRRHILFEIGDYLVLSRLLEGDFLDYRAAIPKSFATEITLQTRAFMNSVERVSLLINDRRRLPVRCI
ncbi:MAG: DNA polymerase III subunit beta, partial [Lachnospiraceae bacterium]|nr:DNA polymerase III subunit beta [Lachnospiraceae bacterium]